MSEAFYTIGHSTRSLADFVDLLHGSEVRLIVDVRRLPGSTRYPQFNRDVLPTSLADVGIAYQHAPGLTGRRPVSDDVPFQVNGWWTNRSFHNYADHALSDDFAQTLAELRRYGHNQRLAVMCSEAVWWRCHRRIIADHLLAHGEQVRHILGPGHVDPAQLSGGAVVGNGSTVTYPAGRSSPRSPRRT